MTTSLSGSGGRPRTVVQHTRSVRTGFRVVRSRLREVVRGRRWSIVRLTGSRDKMCSTERMHVIVTIRAMWSRLVRLGPAAQGVFASALHTQRFRYPVAWMQYGKNRKRNKQNRKGISIISTLQRMVMVGVECRASLIKLSYGYQSRIPHPLMNLELHATTFLPLVTTSIAFIFTSRRTTGVP